MNINIEKAVQTLIRLGISETEARIQIDTGQIILPSNTTDNDITNIVYNFPGLVSISMGILGNKNITDYGITELAKHSVGLRYVYFQYCDNLTDITIKALADYCNHLKNVTIYGKNISNIGYGLARHIETRPRHPPLEDKWWMDDGTGPSCKGMMN